MDDAQRLRKYAEDDVAVARRRVDALLNEHAQLLQEKKYDEAIEVGQKVAQARKLLDMKIRKLNTFH